MLHPCESTFLRAVDAAESDTLRMGVVQDFDGVAVEGGDNGAGEVSKSMHTGTHPEFQYTFSRLKNTPPHSTD